MRATLHILVLLSAGAAGAVQPAHPRAVTLKGHAGWVGAVVFAPDGKRLASGSADGTIRWWDPVRGVVVRTWKAHAGPVCSLAVAPNGKTLASGSYDKTIKLWHSAKPDQPVALAGHKGVVTSLAYSPDGKMLASGSIDGSVRLWEIPGGRQAAILRGHRSWVNAVQFGPGGQLVTGGSDNVANLWVRQGNDWTIQATMKVPEGEIRSVALGPNGKTLAVGTRYGTVRVWNVTNRKQLAVLKGHPGDVWSVAFSPDGRTLASGAGDWDRPGEVRLWDTRKWTRRATLPHTGEVLCVAFSPDGRRLAAGSWDRTIKVFDLTSASGQQ